MDLYIFTQKEKTSERNFKLTALKSTSQKLSSTAVSVEELPSKVFPDQPDCSLKVEDETQIDFTEQEAYLREIIDNNRKMIHKFEQEIQELKCQPSIKMMFTITDHLILKTVT